MRSRSRRSVVRWGAGLTFVVAALVAAVVIATGQSGDKFDERNSNLTPSTLQSFSRHDVLWLGDEFEGLPLTQLSEKIEPAAPGFNPPIPSGVNMVLAIYGTCRPPVGEEGGCQPPLQVQTWPACEVALSDFDRVDARLTIRGVPALETGDQLALATGGVTVKIFGTSRAQVRRAAAALVFANRNGPATGAPLPVPVTVPSQAPCQATAPTG